MLRETGEIQALDDLNYEAGEVIGRQPLFQGRGQ
jgi:hypothetical protein